MIKYIDEPIKMKEEALQDMKALLEKYPFFHTANLLFVKAAHNIQDDLYNSEINKVSASIPNREILHELINLKEIQIVVEEKDDKPKESKTRSDIRKRITERRQKRKTHKESVLLESGKGRHLSLIKDFFEPVLEKLVKNVENFRVIIKNDALPSSKDEAISEVSVEDERAKKKAEREQRMAEKRRLKAEEATGDDKEKRKAVREKRKADREKRMADRIAGKTVEAPVEGKSEVILDDREKRRLERQKRKEAKEKEITKKIAEKQNEAKPEETSKEKKDIVSDEIQIISEVPENNKVESKSTNKIDVKDPFTKIISIPSVDEKEKDEKVKKVTKIKKEDVKVNTVKEKKEDTVESKEEIEDIYSKILSSKRQKPLSKEREKNEITNKIDLVTSDKIEIKSEVEGKKETDKIVDIIKEEIETIVEDKIDEIEFIVEDKKDLTKKEETIKKEEEIVVIDENEEFFELIEKKEDESKVSDVNEGIFIIEEEAVVKKEEKVQKLGDKGEKKAASSVFDRIAAYKSKKGASSKISEKRNKLPKKEEVVLKEQKVEDKKKASVIETKEEKIEIVEVKNVEIELSDADNSLIDKFISGKPAMKRPIVEEVKENVDISEESVKVKKPVVTELMASIYVNQAKYNDAIEIYEQLILKNPEKKDYFASKIKETEKLK